MEIKDIKDVKAIRLDKYLADMQQGSRSEIKELIRKGRITVDAEVVKRPEEKVYPGKSIVEADGVKVGYTHFEYYMLNKPAGVVSATEDNTCKTVVECIASRKRRDLFPVGRLDKDTEGLLIITNDGELAHRLLSPKRHIDKVYYAVIDGNFTKEMADRIENGIELSDFTAMPAKVRVISGSEERSEIEITVQEGKFHQVKRMFLAVGRTVTYLKRLSMGGLLLDESLKPGEYRELTDNELAAIQMNGEFYGNNV